MQPPSHYDNLEQISLAIFPRIFSHGTQQTQTDIFACIAADCRGDCKCATVEVHDEQIGGSVC